MNESFVVTGIGTEIGKTIVSAVLCEAFQCDYWKPIQAGDLHALDSDQVVGLTSNTVTIPSRHLLTTAQSPHEAARVDGLEITMSDFRLPQSDKKICIEGAGGLTVPLNESRMTYLDVFRFWNIPVYIVTKHYLGSINHTLLTLHLAQKEGLKVVGLIVNGERHEPSERIYKQHFPEYKITFIPKLDNITSESISKAAEQWKNQLG